MGYRFGFYGGVVSVEGFDVKGIIVNLIGVGNILSICILLEYILVFIKYW